MDSYTYPHYVSWGGTDSNSGGYCSFAIEYLTPYDKPRLYINGSRVTDAEFAAVHGHFLPAIAYPPTNANQRS